MWHEKRPQKKRSSVNSMGGTFCLGDGSGSGHRLAQDSIHRTTVISILVCEKNRCLGAVREVCCIDQ